MENAQEEIKELRPKDECEKQLAVELAVGAIDSIDSLIEQGHEVACEYACQLLFDNLREKVAKQKNLPVRIVQHLLKDRCESIRLKIIKTNWKSLTTEQQEEVICGIELFFSSLTEDDREQYVRGYMYRVPQGGIQRKHIINTLLKASLQKRDETTALRYSKILGLYKGLPIEDDKLVEVLKDMPNLFRVYWKEMDVYKRKADIVLAHPDEDVRMKEVKMILDKKTRASDLSSWRKIVGRARQGENLKGKILKLWTTDPDEAIRKLIAETSTNVEVLEILSTDTSATISQIAHLRYKKFQKRTEYSKAYQERKREKKRQEEQAAYEKRQQERQERINSIEK